MKSPVYIRHAGEEIRQGIGLQRYVGTNLVLWRLHLRARNRRLALTLLWLQKHIVAERRAAGMSYRRLGFDWQHVRRAS